MWVFQCSKPKNLSVFSSFLQQDQRYQDKLSGFCVIFQETKVILEKWEEKEKVREETTTEPRLALFLVE